MTYKDAWEAIELKHCGGTCDFGRAEKCKGDKCEYYMALKALNLQYYSEQTEPNEWNCAVCEHFWSDTEENAEKCIYCNDGSNFQEQDEPKGEE